MTSITLYRKGWSKRPNWVYDPELQWGWKRLAALVRPKLGGRGINWKAVRTINNVMMTLHSDAAFKMIRGSKRGGGSKDREFVWLNRSAVARLSGYDLKTVRPIIDALVEVGLVQKQGNGYRPSWDVHPTNPLAWENAEFLFKEIGPVALVPSRNYGQRPNSTRASGPIPQVGPAALVGLLKRRSRSQRTEAVEEADSGMPREERKNVGKNRSATATTDMQGATERTIEEPRPEAERTDTDPTYGTAEGSTRTPVKAAAPRKFKGDCLECGTYMGSASVCPQCGWS